MKQEHGVMQTPSREQKDFRTEDPENSSSMHLPVASVVVQHSHSHSGHVFLSAMHVGSCLW